VAVTKRALAAQGGPSILVGHSYGGAVITEAGNDQNVAGLVYITAFAPDKGESVATLIKDPVPGAPVPPIMPPQDGFLFLDKAKFAEAFAADVAPDAAFMADWRFRGSRSPERRDHDPGVEVEADLVPGGHERPDDPARRAARHVQADRSDGGRGQGQPLRVRVAAGRSGAPDPAGRQEPVAGHEVAASQRQSVAEVNDPGSNRSPGRLR
jgi:pimeloyl-ACP methyl ester carboxylesterase